ncbi:MAG: response regulator [Anaerolineaceae bacterium]|nr:MAG: response regulator [Anaerolineaceae bacterium]
MPDDDRTEKMLVMAVDDDWLNRELLEGLLTVGGWRPLLVAASVEAEAIAVRDQPAVILLDVRMPELDGYALCAALRANPATRATPIILMSAGAVTAESRQQAQVVGAQAIIERPSDADTLTACIRQAINPHEVT